MITKIIGRGVDLSGEGSASNGSAQVTVSQAVKPQLLGESAIK